MESSKSMLERVLGALHPRRVHESVLSAMTRVRGGDLTPACVARSVAWGVFVGATPLFGFHTLLAVAPAMFFRLDPLIAYLGSNISIPPMIPILLYCEAQIGSLLLHGQPVPLQWDTLSPQNILEVGSSLVLGSLVVATLLAASLATASYWIARAWLPRRALKK